MVFGLGLCLALLATTPTSSYAIPVAGTYEWEAGSVLTGTFTSNGSVLTFWHMTDGVTTWQTSDPIPLTNDKDQFFAIFPAPIQIVWETGGPMSAAILASETDFSNAFKLATAVPEPSGLALVSLGLGLLALYSWRQRRQTGLQIG